MRTSPNDRPSDAWFSVVLYPRYVRLFWLDGAALDDPDGLLEGQGNRVRSLRLDPDAGIVSAPAVQSLLKRAVATSDAPYNPKARRRLIIRSVSAKRRPRRVPSSSIAR